MGERGAVARGGGGGASTDGSVEDKRADLPKIELPDGGEDAAVDVRKSEKWDMKLDGV
jgi:hypothetical protein